MTNYQPHDEYSTVFSAETDITDLMTSSSSSSSLSFVSISNKSPCTRRRRLRFALDSNQIFPIIHIHDMTECDIRATWYERDDYRAIKSSIVSLAKRISRGEFIEENNFQTARGLEYRTKRGSARRSLNKQEAINTVLEEQQRQLVIGERDPEFLSDCYKTVSFHCQGEANHLAMLDECWVQKELIDMRCTLRNTSNKTTPNEDGSKRTPPTRQKSCDDSVKSTSSSTSTRSLPEQFRSLMFHGPLAARRALRNERPGAGIPTTLLGGAAA